MKPENEAIVLRNVVTILGALYGTGFGVGLVLALNQIAARGRIVGAVATVLVVFCSAALGTLFSASVH